MLGVGPAFGRDLEAADDRLNGPRVVVISDALWRRRFGGDRGVVGRQLTLDGDDFTVVGVMPPTLENVLAPSAELWAPPSIRHVVGLRLGTSPANGGS